MNSENPYRAPQFAEPVVAPVTQGLSPFWLRILIAVQATVIVAGLLASFVYIESIIPTGILLSAAGIATLICGWKRRDVAALLFGGSGPAISVVCLAIILLMSWGPNDASRPIPMIGTGYAVVAISLGLYAAVIAGGGRSRDDVKRA